MIDLSYKHINILIELLSDDIIRLTKNKNDLIEKRYEGGAISDTPAYEKTTGSSLQKSRIDTQLAERTELRDSILSEVLKLGFKFGVDEKPEKVSTLGIGK